MALLATDTTASQRFAVKALLTARRLSCEVAWIAPFVTTAHSHIERSAACAFERSRPEVASVRIRREGCSAFAVANGANVAKKRDIEYTAWRRSVTVMRSARGECFPCRSSARPVIVCSPNRRCCGNVGPRRRPHRRPCACTTHQASLPALLETGSRVVAANNP